MSSRLQLCRVSLTPDATGWLISEVTGGGYAVVTTTLGNNRPEFDYNKPAIHDIKGSG